MLNAASYAPCFIVALVLDEGANADDDSLDISYEGLVSGQLCRLQE